ncbi:MAG TPA: ERF family protein, partial [Hyphomicrobiaceae bacterium]
RPRKPARPQLPAQPSSLLEAIIFAASDAAVDIAKVEHLIRLRKEMEAAEAEHAFNNAMAVVQARLTPIVADAVNDQTHSRYATYATLDRVVRPIYTAEGFALTFTAGERSTDTAVELVAYLTGHGHSRRYTVTMPADGLGPKGTPVMNRTHAASSAITYGMRRLLTMIWNLAIDRDDDGNAAGKPQSAYRARRENHYPRVEKRVRSAKTVEELASVWAEEQAVISAWPAKWRDHIVEEKDLRKAALTGTMDALEASLAYLDTDPQFAPVARPRVLPIKTTMWRKGE